MVMMGVGGYMFIQETVTTGMAGKGRTWGNASELQPTDEQLVALVAAGKDWALRKIHERYSRLVFHVAYKHLGDSASAEEIVQEVFIKLWRNACEYRAERGRLSSWLITITQNQCFDELRRRRVRPTLEPMEEEIQVSQAGESNPGQALDHVLDRARVAAALARIPSEQRTVIELAFFEGLTHPEIAYRCGDPLGTVKTRLRLGLSKLKGLLEEA